jgi:hypothetical protein
VAVQGRVENRTTRDVVIPRFRVEVLSKSGRVLDEQTYTDVRLAARSGRNYAPRFTADGRMPARIRVTLKDKRPGE